MPFDSDLRLTCAVFSLFLAATCVQTPAVAATFDVSDAAGLRAALLAAATNSEDDAIVLAAGTYVTSGTAFTFLSNESNTLTLQGASGTTRDQVVLDGGDTSQVLSFSCPGSCGAITLQGLTVRNGNATGNGNGGGVHASPSLSLSDMVLSGNRSSSSGGAISGSNVTVTGSSFSNNTAGSGGAISAVNNVTVTNATFSGNSATSGGGGAIGGNATVTNSTFSGNSATYGGGGAIAGPTVTVNNSAFSNNTAAYGGGGAISGNATVTSSAFSGNSATNDNGGAISGSAIVINSIFSGNSAAGTFNTCGGKSCPTPANGGAIYGGVTVTNSIFSNNTAPGNGGAIYGHGTVANSLFVNNTAGGNGGAINGTGIIVNNTFSSNTAVVSGAAIYISSTSSIINSVFYGHATPVIYAGSPCNIYNNLIDTSTGVAGTAAIMVGNVAPGATSPFVDAVNGNFRLAAGSLAVNTGLDPNSTTFTNLAGSSVASIRQALLTDLQGNPRPTPGTAVDIGAYEFLPMPILISQSDCLFAWAEGTYASLFAPVGAISNTFAPYYYRYYSQTSTYLGTSSDDNHVYYLGPLSNYSLFDVGALSGWLSNAGCQ